MEDEQPQDWYFSFGFGQPFVGRYHVIHGTFDEARHAMSARFTKWSAQYATAEELGVEEFGLVEIK